MTELREGEIDLRMAAVIRSKKSAPVSGPRWKGAFMTGLSALALILALGSYRAEDPSLNTFSSSWKAPGNVLGYFGSFVADIFYQLFGWSAWLWAALSSVELARWLRADDKSKPVIKMRDSAGLALALMGTTLLLHLLRLDPAGAGFPPQGLLGIALASASIPFFGTVGSYFVCSLFLWFFCMVWWEELPLHLLRLIRKASAFAWSVLSSLGKNVLPKVSLPTLRVLKWARPTAKPLAPVLSTATPITSPSAGEGEDLEETEDNTPERGVQSEVDGQCSITHGGPPLIRTAEVTPAKAERVRKSTAPARTPDDHTDWSLPPMALLQGAKTKIKGATQEQLFATAAKITNALKSFDIEGEVVEISPGPVITMYEFQPGPGVRVQKLVSASTDLAMTLGVPSVRIVAPIPGKSVAGIEVPNAIKEEIVLKDVYEQTNDRAKTMKLPLVMGRDIEGKPVIEDLARMPHLLVGGATSMGKSVLVNSILTGLLCRFNPNELKLIIVDPKLVEFKIFEDIPHLLLPIVNDPSDASQALKWAVAETKRRYLEMQKVSAKNLEAYNNKMMQEAGGDATKRLPYIVIIIDELAELMLTAKKDVEQSIVRLSQLARAAGIHLIMATQRPSADVVTGLIKSNCPSRAALRVASASDSRIILDCSGAEQLLGKGDLFFTNTGPMGLRRMQGCFVSDEELEKICDFWREQGEPAYKEEILAPELSDEEQEAFGAAGGDNADALYADVIEFAKEKGKISTSLIQRRFQIGYTRAARIMEQLEERGVVGEQVSAGKARDVII